MVDDDDIGPVLRKFPAAGHVRGATPLGSAGGFSGARLWRIATPAGDFALRRWPPTHPDETRLRAIHAVLQTAWEHGIREIPLPQPTADGATFAHYAGRLWELAPWLPGRADFRDDPRPEKLSAALAWLARFHLAVAPSSPPRDRSPGIGERCELLRRLLDGEAAEIARRLPDVGWPEFAVRAQRVLAAFAARAAGVAATLAEARAIAASLQPCVRDIWRDHVLFQGERVSGVVDFGAMREESVAGDFARLLGSLAGNDAEAWRRGADAYGAIRPLDESERRLANAFDASGVLLSGMNWLRWICLQHRQFERPQQVLARVDEILMRLEGPSAPFLG